jgi:hypothetical protein
MLAASLVQPPWLDRRSSAAKPGENVPANRTSGALVGPLLATTCVNVTRSPTATVAGVPERRSARSARAGPYT